MSAQLNTQSHVFEKYQTYVVRGIDEELKQFHDKGNIVPYLGSDSFTHYGRRINNNPRPGH